MVWQTKRSTLGTKPGYVVVFTLVFDEKITKNCFALPLLRVINIKVDRSFKNYGYLIFLNIFLSFWAKKTLYLFYYLR